MLKKRIIPCLDIKNGRTVKGINFKDIRDAGSPIQLAKRYVLEQADELVFLDISATIEKRKTLKSLVKEIAAEINIPFTVGGGISSLENVAELLQAGADKVSINSAAIKRPELLEEVAKSFGSQCLVLAMDIKKMDDHWSVFINGGRVATDLTAMSWAKQAEDLGVGEILLTSMDSDGTKNGFALEITQAVSESVSIPIIASGGAGLRSDFKNLFEQTSATGALAASVFHFDEIPIPSLKSYLKDHKIAIR